MGFFYCSKMSRLSIIFGSKLPYCVTFVIDKFTIRELCNQIGNTMFLVFGA